MLPWFSGLNASHHLSPEQENSIKYWSVLVGVEWSQWWLSWGELYRNILYSWWFLRFLIEKIESQSGFRDGKTENSTNIHSWKYTDWCLEWKCLDMTIQYIQLHHLCTTLQLTAPIRKQRGSQISTMSTLAPTWGKSDPSCSNLRRIQRRPNNLQWWFLPYLIVVRQRCASQLSYEIFLSQIQSILNQSIKKLSANHVILHVWCVNETV